MTILIHGKQAMKTKTGKTEPKKPLTPTERDLEEKRIAEMMYPTAAKKVEAPVT